MAKIGKEDWSRYFYYDIESKSKLSRAIPWILHRYEREPIGANVGSLSVGGYWTTSVGGISYKCHRIVYELFNGKIQPDQQVDHIDGNRANNLIENLRIVTPTGNNRNKSKMTNNTSGKTGVSHREHKVGDITYNSWVAFWQNLNGKLCTKSFNWSKLGKDIAFVLACEWRDKMIEELNRAGAGYTQKHGS